MSSSSSSTPKRPSFKNRMGTMMRRSSTALTLNRSGSQTPPPGGDSDSGSVRGRGRSGSVDTVPPTDRQSSDSTPAPKPESRQEQPSSQFTASPEPQFSPAPQIKVESESPESSRQASLEGSISSSKPKVNTLAADANADTHEAPSPIPESPISEAAAVTEHTVGLSKLAHELKPEDISDAGDEAPDAEPEAAPAPAPAESAKPASVHEEGFGAGEREPQPKTQVVSPPEQHPHILQPTPAQIERNLEDVPILTQTPEQTSLALPQPASSGDQGSIAPTELSVPYIPRTSTPPPFEGTGTVATGSPNLSRTQSRDDLAGSNVWVGHAAQPQREQVQRSVSPSRQGSPGRPAVYIQRSTSSQVPSRNLSAKPSRSSLAPGGGAAGGNKDATNYTWSNSSTRSLGMVYAQGAPGFGVQERNPFDDPSSSQVNLPHAGAHDKSPSETIKVPEGFDPRSPHDERQLDDHQADPVPVPLPAASEVMLSRHSRELPEGYDVFGAGPTQDYFDQGPKPTNERLPLLGNRTYTPGRDLHRAPSIDSQIASWKPKSANGHGHGDAPSTANGNGNGNGHAHESSETANDDGDLAATKRPLSHAHYPGYGAGGYGAVSFPFAARGWAEHVLPHGARYFVHPGVRAVADADLRRLVELDVVSGVVGRAGIVPDGCEMWIREVYPANKNGGKKKGAQKKGWFNGSGKGKGRSEDVEVAWVDHRARRVSRDVPSVAERAGEEDRLDDEYRYWSFVESHPSHVHPRPDLRQEALDALRWSYTDQLLAYPQPVPSPFSTDECMQLERLLSANGLVPERNAVQTRLIARILLRVVHWRQQHFRPQKPLPEDVPQAQAQAQLAARRRPSVFRTILDILIGIACLGIPFMFENKAQPGSAFDIEGGALPHHAGSMFVAGGVACLVAAIILSASVTLVTLPGIDEIARIAGIVAIACSVASMISAFAVIFRHKAEVYHGRSHGVGGANGIGGEGFIVLSRRSVLLSLPLAFLAYSVAGFVTGILVYSFKSAPGAVVSLPVIPEAMSMVSQSLPTTADVKVESWSRWTALGALGGLSVAVLATAYAARK